MTSCQLSIKSVFRDAYFRGWKQLVSFGICFLSTNRSASDNRFFEVASLIGQPIIQASFQIALWDSTFPVVSINLCSTARSILVCSIWSCTSRLISRYRQVWSLITVEHMQPDSVPNSANNSSQRSTWCDHSIVPGMIAASVTETACAVVAYQHASLQSCCLAKLQSVNDMTISCSQTTNNNSVIK